jgi:hypothetical protein
MSFDLVMVLGLSAVAVMVYNVFYTLATRKELHGGMIGKRWSVMTLLVVLFLLGYMVLPFLATMPAEVLRVIVSLIFLFGAIYVTITLRLVYGIVRELRS